MHVVPIRIYYVIFATLLLLTLVTVDIAFFNFGILNIYFALALATAKATLVILYFMHVRYSSPLTWLYAAVGFVFLLVLLAFTFSDFVARDWLTLPGK
jgi:cytochrome c oxidase subunit 4